MMKVNGERDVTQARRVFELGGVLVGASLMLGCITEEDLRQSSWYKGDEVEITVYEPQAPAVAVPAEPIRVSTVSAPQPAGAGLAGARPVSNPGQVKPVLVKPVPAIPVVQAKVEAPKSTAVGAAKEFLEPKVEAKPTIKPPVAALQQVAASPSLKETEIVQTPTVKAPEIVTAVKVEEVKAPELKVVEPKEPELKVAKVNEVSREAGQGLDSGLEALKAKAASGDAAARFDLAHRYRTGSGVDQDLEQAFRLYSEGAGLRHGPSLNNAAVMLLQGKAGKPDAGKAVEMLKLAAEQGVAQAQGNLVRVYYDGLGGVEKNFEEARMWYRRASQTIEVPQEIAYMNP